MVCYKDCFTFNIKDIFLLFIAFFITVLLIVPANASKLPRVTRAILTEPSFQLESVKFVLGNVPSTPGLKKVKPFSFYNCKYSTMTGLFVCLFFDTSDESYWHQAI
jgi:hypothetical protein